MRVSVIIPVYNKAPFLQEAMDSILNGSYTDFELIAVDDKSTDESLALLKTITDSRLRIIELPQNLGPAGAANAAIDAANGEYIVRMDADDIAVPERIAVQIAFMDNHPEVGASGGQMQLFGEEHSIWKFPLTQDRCAAQQLFGVPVAQPSSILRHNVLIKHNLRFDPLWPRFGEDWLFWIRFGRVSRFANVPEALLHYRRGPQNISQTGDKLANYTQLVRDVLTFYDLPFTEEEVGYHLMNLTLFRDKPTTKALQGLRAWNEKLLALNAERCLFPHAAFTQHLNEVWDRLFHYLPRHGVALALEHMRLSGKWPKERLLYLSKWKANDLLGKKPT